MNELFELLHRGHTALGVFAIDVAVFGVLMLVFYALIYLAVHKVSEFLPRDPDVVLMETPDLNDEDHEEFVTEDVDEICRIYR